MARLRRTPRRALARRRNPRTTGAVIINPRRKIRRKPVRRRVARRRNTAVKRRRNTAKRRSYTTRRRNTAKRRVSARRRSNPKRRRSAPKVIYRYRKSNPRRRKVNRRRNPSPLTALKKSISKLPIIGKTLASTLGFLPTGLFGALSVVPTTMLARTLGQYVPAMNSSLFYVLTGGLLAAIVQNTSFLGKALHQKLAVAIAAAAGGVAFYKYQTGADGDMAGEIGMLGGPIGDLAGGYAIAPYGNLAYPVNGMHGALKIEHHGMHGHGMYHDASMHDVVFSGFDMAPEECGAILGGEAGMTATFGAPVPRRYARNWRRRRFRGVRVPPNFAVSRHAGLPGHRWGWLIKMIGWERTMELVRMPPDARQQYLRQLKEHAITTFPTGQQQIAAEMAGVIYAA